MDRIVGIVKPICLPTLPEAVKPQEEKKDVKVQTSPKAKASGKK